MPNITSYFNPVSPEHHATEDFKKLSAPKQALTIVLTVFATILTLPILGLGGVATFRALTEDFFVKKLDINNPSTPQESAAHKAHSTVRQSKLASTSSAAPEKIPEETQKKYIHVLSSYFAAEDKTLHNESNALMKEKDTFFDIAAKSLNTSPDEIIQKMKEYIKNNPQEVNDLIKNHTKDIDTFKNFLMDENVVSKSNSSISFLDFQKALNLVRSELLTKIYPVKVVIHEMYINHDENFDKSGTTVGKVFPESGRHIDIMHLKEHVYGDGQGKETLEMASAQVIKANGNFISGEKPDTFFVQPRLLTKAE